jgi:hypothetical protein
LRLSEFEIFENQLFKFGVMKACAARRAKRVRAKKQKYTVFLCKKENAQALPVCGKVFKAILAWPLANERKV